MANSNVVLQYYQLPGLSDGKVKEKIAKLRSVASHIADIKTEFCCYVECKAGLSQSEEEQLKWLLTPTFDTIVKKDVSALRTAEHEDNFLFIEIGPRLNFSTAYSTNAVSICAAVGLGNKINRIERSVLYRIHFKGSIDKATELLLVDALHDRMTEQRYVSPIKSFHLLPNSQPWVEIDVINNGIGALRNISAELGLSFDEWDLHYYTNLFRDTLKRNPTSVECFDLAQSNSEHSRHWFFKGRMIVDGHETEQSLIDMVGNTQKHSNSNNIIKFNDNSSAIRGFPRLNLMLPVNSTEASLVTIAENATRHIIFTAETHNFPTGVAPFPGATTGTGGRIRDVHATGRGAHVIAGTAGYSFGNLLIPGYNLPWEDNKEVYPRNFALPVDVCIEASNGASDYGNKFGEPLLAGFARSFGMRLYNEERYEWIKPIMFSGGIGSIDDKHVKKEGAEKGMTVTKIGGPIYRIGVGGGAASSVEVQGDEANEELDFGAVQRGDPEMEQKLNRLIRACIEYNEYNPIQSIHDQGAGGNGNVLKEIVEPKGAVIYTDRFTLGDPTINTLELWGAEYQESDAILVRKEHEHLLRKISEREKCSVNFVGEVTGDGCITLVESGTDEKHPVSLDLQYVLASMPRKVFNLERNKTPLHPLKLPSNLSVTAALQRVLRMPAVASKRYLTNKVDRSVTGLVAQQQCIGPLHTPLADYAVIALSYFNLEGAVTSIGEQPLKGLISPGANGRLSVAEAITNMMFCCITELADVKCSGNWMWAAKLPGEGAKLVETCEAMCGLMKALHIAVDGGKDSLSMAAKVKLNNGQHEVVKSPGTLVISAYAPVPDITKKVTPVLKVRQCKLLYINLSGSSKMRIGGSVLAQAYGQIGNESADLDKPDLLLNCFEIVQHLIRKGICTAGHDISDGGLITCLLEMAFASNCGVKANFDAASGISDIEFLFAEECGVIIEVTASDVDAVIKEFNSKNIFAQLIGEATWEDNIHLSINGRTVLEAKMTVLRDLWEEISFELEKRQARNECVLQEKESLKHRKQPKWQLTFDPKEVKLRNIDSISHFSSAPRVAVLREEGINGDREMIASLYMVGFEVADVTITDVTSKRGLNLESFRGLIFPGGFSYADVLGSARGWAGTMKFNPSVEEQLKRFKARSNTFSLGVCNGCQLLALLGWISPEQDGSQGVVLGHNDSERFESRFVSVRIESDNRAIMLKDMDDTVMGVWVAHGEGKFIFRNERVRENASNFITLRYVDDDGKWTTDYPFNPNGSEMGIAGMCSEDGRHLAMMPHPERCTYMWQWPYVPGEWATAQTSPWCKMFRNAYEWCVTNV